MLLCNYFAYLVPKITTKSNYSISKGYDFHQSEGWKKVLFSSPHSCFRIFPKAISQVSCRLNPVLSVLSVQLHCATSYTEPAQPHRRLRINCNLWSSRNKVCVIWLFLGDTLELTDRNAITLSYNEVYISFVLKFY